MLARNQKSRMRAVGRNPLHVSPMVSSSFLAIFAIPRLVKASPWSPLPLLRSLSRVSALTRKRLVRSALLSLRRRRLRESRQSCLTAAVICIPAVLLLWQTVLAKPGWNSKEDAHAEQQKI